MDDSLWMQLSGHNSLGTPNIDGFFYVIIYFDGPMLVKSGRKLLRLPGCQAASVRKQFWRTLSLPLAKSNTLYTVFFSALAGRTKARVRGDWLACRRCKK